MTPRAVPHPDVARAPALQWVSTTEPSFKRVAPYLLRAMFASMSSSLILSASLKSSSWSKFESRAFLFILSIAHMRLTAVGLAEERKSHFERNSSVLLLSFAAKHTPNAAVLPINGAPLTIISLMA